MAREDVTILIKAKEAVGRAIGQAQSKMSGMGKKISQSVRGMGQAFGIMQLASIAALVAVTKATIDLGVQFESSMIAVKAVAGATALEFENLEATAREMGATTIFTAAETANAMYDLASAGLEIKDIIGALPGVIALAVSQQASLQFATETVTSTLATFGLESSDAAHVSDVFAEAISSSKLNLDKLSTALAFAGPAAAGFGIDLEETVAGLGAFADLGLSASMIGTTFRMGLIQLTQALPAEETLDAAETVAKLGLEFKDINPAVVGLTGVIENLRKTNINMQDAIAIFGARAAGPFLKLIKDVNINLRENTERLERANKAQAIMTEVMGTTRSQMKEMNSAAEEMKLQFFGVIRPQVRLLIKEWTEWLRLVNISQEGFQDAAIALANWNAPLGTQVVRLEGWAEALLEASNAAQGVEAAQAGLGKETRFQTMIWEAARLEGIKVRDAMKELGFEFKTNEDALKFVRVALNDLLPQWREYMATTDGAKESTDELNDGLDETDDKIKKVGHTAEEVQFKLASSLARTFSAFASTMDGSSAKVLEGISTLAEGALGIMQTVKFVSDITSASVKATLGPILIILEIISAALRLFGVFRGETPMAAAPATMAPAGAGAGAGGPAMVIVNFNGDVLGDGTTVAENMRSALADLKQRTGRTVEQGAF